MPAAVSDVDLFSDGVLADPFPTYRELRDRAPAVLLERHGTWFVGRYAEVRSALLDWRTFSSARGVGLNPIINEAWKDAELCQDPPAHTALRKLFTDRLGARQLAAVSATIDAKAAELADRLAVAGEFDGVSDLAHQLPMQVIMDLVGWPADGRQHLLEMAAGSFDACGPDNARMQAAVQTLDQTMQYVAEIYVAKALSPGSFGYTIAQAADRGEISADEAIGLLSGYVVAAFDTTINAIASGAWLFAQNPAQWAKLRADPALVTSAVNEVLRMETPIQHLARVTTRDVDLGDRCTIPGGARVLLSYASANRDERHYADPDTMRIDRAANDHLAFGAGVHACAGQSLAKIEAVSMLHALADRVRRLELVRTPTRALNNMTRGFGDLPLRACE